MGIKLDGRKLAQIESVMNVLLDQLKRGVITRMNSDQELVLEEYAIDETWEIRFVPSMSSGRSKRDTLSPTRFVATAPDQSVTLTVDNRQLHVRKPKVNRPLRSHDRGMVTTARSIGLI